MKMFRLHMLTVILLICMLSITAPLPVNAQRSNLQERPKQEGKTVVPIAQQATINIDIWLNKQCGTPFYTGEKALIYFQTDVDGYVTLYDIDTRGNVLVIFPNRYTPDNYVKGGQAYQIPAQRADYDLIVTGPEGIEYIEGVASTDPYYHWNHRQGEPRWLQELNLKGNKGREYEASVMDQETTVAYRKSSEYRQVPEEFGATGLQSLTKNFQVSQRLREQVRSKLVVRPRETEQPQGKVEPIKKQVVENYSTATCYMYIVDASSSRLQERSTQEEEKIAQVYREPVNIDLWFDKQCGSSYYTGDQHVVYFQTDTDGYVTLYNIDTRGNISIIFPNRHTPDNHVRAGQPYAVSNKNGEYSFFVEGPEGVKYIDAMASTDTYYHWNYNQGEPRWLQDWGLKGGKRLESSVSNTDLTTSAEYQNRPQEFGKTGLKSLVRNFKISQSLQEQTRMKIETRSREAAQSSYSTASCYMYVVDRSSSFREEPVREAPQQPVRPIAQVAETQATLQVDLWFDKQCGSPYYTGEKIVIYFSTDVDGYVTLYDIDTQGNVAVIFPNQHNPDNYVKGGQSYTIPNKKYTYDLVVEGPEGIEYIDAVASTNSSYHWNYNQGEPRWLREWDLKGGKFEAGRIDQSTVTALKSSHEFKNRPLELSETGVQSLNKNYQISQSLREQVRSKLVVRPRASETVQPQPTKVAVDYSTTSCYFYVVDGSAKPSTQPLPPRIEYLREQEQDLQQIPNFDVRRIENRLIVEMPGQVLFDFDSYALRQDARQNLNQVIDILLRYPETNIMVMGHTDSVGEVDYNQRLSEYRAQAVAEYLVRQGVESYRINWAGYGESMPVASNSTEEGRQRNRRVELEIRVNDQYGQ